MSFGKRVVLSFSALLAPTLALAATVNINSAAPEAIAEGLQGIGPAKAQAIVAYREANGPFEDVEELLEVEGIGERTLEQNRNAITLE